MTKGDVSECQKGEIQNDKRGCIEMAMLGVRVDNNEPMGGEIPPSLSHRATIKAHPTTQHPARPYGS